MDERDKESLEDDIGDEDTSSLVLSKLATEQSTRLRRLANQWQVRTRHDPVNLNHEHLEHLHDCFLRSVCAGTELVNFRGFENLLKNVFPPWRRAIDEDVSRAVLQHMFDQIDCDADGLVNWNDFSTSVLKQALGFYRSYEGIQDQMFQKALPDDTYNSQSSYHKEMIHSVKCIGSIGKYITCGRDGSMRIWSSQTRRHLRTVEISKSSPPGWVTCCVDMPGMRTANNPKGVLGVCCMDRTISFYELHQFKLVNRLDLGPVVPLCCDSFTHKNTNKVSTLDQIVVGDVEGNIHLYSVTPNLLQPNNENIQSYAVIHAHSNYVTACRYVKISSKGIIISTSADSKIGLIDAFDHSIKHYRGHEKAVQCFAFCDEPFSYIVSGGQDRAIQIWNPNTSRKISSLVGHQTCVQGLAYNAKSSHIISLSADKEVIVWDPRNYSILCRVRDNMQYRPENTFSAMAWDEKQTALVVANSRFQVWPYADKWAQSEPPKFVLHKTTITATLYNSLFECILTIDLEGLALTWSLEDGSQTGTFNCDDDTNVTCAIFDSTLHRLMTGKDNGVVKVYNWHDGTVLNELLSEAKKEITCIVNTPVEEVRRYTIASGWDRVVYIWKDPPEKFSQQFLTKVDPGGTDVMSMAWLTPQTMAAGCYDGSVVIWSTESVWRKKGRIQVMTQDKSTQCRFEDRDSLAVSCIEVMVPDHECSPVLVTAGMDGIVRLWDPHERSLVNEFPTNHVDESAILPKDGTRQTLPVVCISCHTNQRLIVTGDAIGQIKGFRTSSELLGENVVLLANVIEAKDLASADSDGFSDPYAVLKVREVNPSGTSSVIDCEVYKTSIREKTLCPVWNETLEIKVGHGRASEVSRTARILRCELFDYDKFGDHDALGTVEIPFYPSELNQPKDSWYAVDTHECSRKTPGGSLHLSIRTCITWNKPEVAFAWRAHQDAITNMQFVERGGSNILSGVVVLITTGLDRCTHLWTMTGERIATLGVSTWSQSIFQQTIRAGRGQKAIQLLSEAKNFKTQNSMRDLKIHHGHHGGFASTKGKDRQDIPNSDAVSENLDTVHDMPSPVEGANALHGEGHDNAMSRTRVTDIPTGKYDVLNQIVLDSLIRRRGRLPEETGLVFTRMHVDGKSEKTYTIKESKVHHWNFGKMRDLGIMQAQKVNYGMVDTEQVCWQDRNSEYPEVIAQRPHGTVAATYGMQHSVHKPSKQSKGDHQQANGMRQDSMQRSSDQTREESGARTALSAMSAIPSRGETAPTTPTGLPISHTKASDDVDEPAHRDDRRASKSEFNLNLKKVLTLSLPPHRPEGSWRYRGVDIEHKKCVGTARSTPRFDPTKYVSYPAVQPTQTEMSSMLHSAHTSRRSSRMDHSRPLTARSRIETTVHTSDISFAPTVDLTRRKPQSARGHQDLVTKFGANRKVSPKVLPTRLDII